MLVLDDLSTGVWESGAEPVLFQAGALGDPALAGSFRDFAPHRVFHLAARHYIPWCDAHPEQTYDVNVNGLRWLLRSLCPAATSRGHSTPPTNPAPPVTRTRTPAPFRATAARRQQRTDETWAGTWSPWAVDCSATGRHDK